MLNRVSLWSTKYQEETYEKATTNDAKYGMRDKWQEDNDMI